MLEVGLMLHTMNHRSNETVRIEACYPLDLFLFWLAIILTHSYFLVAGGKSALRVLDSVGELDSCQASMQVHFIECSPSPQCLSSSGA